MVNLTNDNLTIIPKKNYHGPISVNIAVSDGKGTDETNFILNVKAVNDAPVLELVSDYTINEDEILSLSLSATDIDYVSYDFNATSNENLIVEVNNNLMQISPNLETIFLFFE